MSEPITFYSVLTGKSKSESTPFIRIESSDGQSMTVFITPAEAREVALSLHKMADEYDSVLSKDRQLADPDDAT